MKIILLIILIATFNLCCSRNSMPDMPLESKEAVFVETPATEWVETPEEPNFGTGIDTAKPNLLVVGDSISIGYTGPLINEMSNEYDVRHPVDNCRNSFYTLLNIDKWLADYPNNSVIVWNNGIWDSTRNAWREENNVLTSPVEWYGITPEQYEANIIQIARKLKATGARVLFMTTTDISPITAVFVPGKELIFNEIAKRVLPLEGIEVHDLYTFGKSIPDGHTNNFDVHFKNHANVKLAKFIADIVRIK